jgi:hypothetical protein
MILIEVLMETNFAILEAAAVLQRTRSNLESPMSDLAYADHASPRVDHRKRSRAKPAPQPELPSRKALDQLTNNLTKS